MRKIIFSFLFLFLIPYSFAQEIKKVAVLPPIDKENKVDYIYEHMFRTNMVKAISNAKGYICLNMDVVDEIIDVVQFQESGFVKDDEIQNLGMMQGANFICKSEITKKDSNLYISITISEIESGITLPGKTDDILTEFNAESIYKACQQLTSKLFEIKVKDVTLKTGTFVDKRDNQTYNWVSIGDQIWMAENLRFKDKDSYCYNNQPNCYVHGRLYNWETANNVCPEGWHLPSESEWEDLALFIKNDKDLGEGYAEVVGYYLKSEYYWQNGGNGNNYYKFNGLPSGFFVKGLQGGNPYLHFGNTCAWWTSKELNDEEALFRVLYDGGSSFSSRKNLKIPYYSVRCIKN